MKTQAEKAKAFAELHKGTNAFDRSVTTPDMYSYLKS